MIIQKVTLQNETFVTQMNDGSWLAILGVFLNIVQPILIIFFIIFVTYKFFKMFKKLNIILGEINENLKNNNSK